MRKKLVLLAAGAICAATLGTGTLAYFIAEDRAHNVITSGAVSIRIQQWQETEQGRIPYPQEALRVMPGMAVSKVAAVENLGANAYIRAKTQILVTDSRGEPRELEEEVICLSMNRENWVRQGQWWYYTAAVAEGETTQPLFTQVVFDGAGMTNGYQGCTVEVTVQAQAVQAANNGGTPLEAAGWPEEQGGGNP